MFIFQVFKDNCCKREVLNLYVYCKNAPRCNAKITLGRYQVGIAHNICLCPCPVMGIEHLFCDGYWAKHGGWEGGHWAALREFLPRNSVAQHAKG